MVVKFKTKMRVGKIFLIGKCEGGIHKAFASLLIHIMFGLIFHAWPQCRQELAHTIWISYDKIIISHTNGPVLERRT